MSIEAALQKDNTIFVYDGICNLCLNTNSFINYFLRPRSRESYVFRPVQKVSDDEKKIYRLDLSSVSLLRRDKKTKKVLVFKKSDAILMAAQDFRQPLGFFAFCTRMAIPKCIRDSVYGLVAKYRYKIFGKQDIVCEI
jgi:predicted DCC family thiol-disulfide oxidoreductase YuxK